jgi:hypothetical protein
MPSIEVDAIEASTSGWTLAQCELASAQIDARLSKRYATPFGAPVSTIVEGWVTRIVTARAYQKRGANPSDEQQRNIFSDATDAWSEVKEAADAAAGLFDLPLRSDTTQSGIARGGPMGYSERSPYRWWTVQAEAGREDDNG